MPATTEIQNTESQTTRSSSVPSVPLCFHPVPRPAPCPPPLKFKHRGTEITEYLLFPPCLCVSTLSPAPHHARHHTNILKRVCPRFVYRCSEQSDHIAIDAKPSFPRVLRVLRRSLRNGRASFTHGLRLHVLDESYRRTMGGYSAARAVPAGHLPDRHTNPGWYSRNHPPRMRGHWHPQGTRRSHSVPRTPVPPSPAPTLLRSSAEHRASAGASRSAQRSVQVPNPTICTSWS